MHSIFQARLLPLALLCAVMAAASPAPASAGPEPLSLPQAFERAWARQPEAQALAARREAAQALRAAADAWTPEPAALEASLRSDRFNRRQGAQELELGLALPLWLPNERARSQALAVAQAQSVEAEALRAQWQLAQQLREHWWALALAREEQQAAQERWQASQALAADVARRTQAGELARADQHQAEAAAAGARRAVAGAGPQHGRRAGLRCPAGPRAR
ncbi:MAG: hypothetical protein U1E77_07425 [Inhella sp.]